MDYIYLLAIIYVIVLVSIIIVPCHFTENNFDSEIMDKVDKKEHIECSLCKNTFQEPKLLPCFHTFCKVPCLERLVVQDCQGQSLACPICQRFSPLPDSGVAGLQSNLYAENLLKDQLNLSKKIKKRDCENCKKVAAAKYCQQCTKFMCDKCIEMHQMWGDFSDHKLADADDTKIDQQVNNYCKEHQEMEAEYFCETCSNLVCSKCTNDKHKGHKHNLISSVYSKHKLELMSSLKPLQESLDIVQEALVASDDMVKAINNQKATIETDMNAKIDHLQHVLQQRRVELLASVESYAEQKLQKIAIHKDKIKMTKAKMNRCLEYTEAVLKVGTEGEVLGMKASVLKRIEEISAEFEPDATKLSTEADLQWYPNDQATQACQEFGTVFCNSIDGEEIYDDLDFETFSNSAYQAMSRGSIKKPISLPTPASEKQIVHEMPRYSAVIPSLETFRKPVKVISDLSGPFGVTSNSRRQLIVTDSNKNQVLMMTADGQKIASFGKQGSKKGQFKHPCGLTVDQDDNIYVVDTNNHRIQKFSSEGKFLGAVGSPGNNNLQFSYPIGICFNNATRHLYVCDQANSRIQVLSTNLTFVCSFGSQGNGDGELIYPKNAAFDSSNFLYVTDCGNNRVQVFTADGQYTQSFKGKANGKELEKPFAITVDSSNTVHVSELKRHCITRYTAQGKYVSSFGRHGTEEGLFKDIGCLYAYDSAIIVSDTSNNRLQFF